MRGFIAGNAHHICMSTCRMLSDRAEEYIRWPSQYSLEETACQFQFPRTVGKICAQSFIPLILYDNFCL